MSELPFTIVYDAKDPAAIVRARKHRRLWGQLYVDISMPDEEWFG